nr:DinB family protein [Paenibacillus sp. NFR01]
MEQYAAVIGEYQSALKKYSIPQLRYKSAPDVWSLGQMYDHLILAALDYLDQVERCASAAEEQPEGKTAGGAALFEAGAFPDIRIRLPDGPENTPDNSRGTDELRDGLDVVLKRMAEWESRLSEVNHNLKVKHDGFGWLNAQEWFQMIGMHFRHHLRQKSELEQKYTDADQN